MVEKTTKTIYIEKRLWRGIKKLADSKGRAMIRELEDAIRAHLEANNE